MPRRRSREMPMMSAKEKFLDSSPADDQLNVPSVRTPSTSKAMACKVTSCCDSKGSRGMVSFRSDGGPDATKFLDDSHFALVHALDSVAHRKLAQADVAHHAADAVGLQRRCLVAAPHGAVHGDVSLHRARAEDECRNAGRNSGLVPGVADGNLVALAHGGDRLQVQFVIVGRVGAGGVRSEEHTSELQ